MAQTILVKRSNVANKVPTNSQIIDGELALNTNDGRLYTVSGSTGSGTGTIVEIGSRSSFSTAPASPVSGQLWWDSANATLKVWNGSAWVPSVAQLTDINATGNSTLGDASSDTLTVNATSTFNAPVDMNSTLNVDGAFTTTSNSTLGDASSDTLTVNATSTFNAPVDMNSTLNVDGAATFNGSVQLGNAAGDAITIVGTPTFTNGPSPVLTLTGDCTGSGTFTNLNSVSITTTVVESNVDHDLLSNFVANEHIDHTAVSINAGNGLTGGGTIAATRTLAVNAGNGLVADGTDLRMTGSYTGNFTATGNVTAYSDAKLKTDLVPIDSALDKVDELTGYLYTRIDTGRRETGLLAQDAQRVLPESVMDHDGTLTLAYGNLMGLIVEAIKELRQEVKSLKGE